MLFGRNASHVIRVLQASCDIVVCAVLFAS